MRTTLAQIDGDTWFKTFSDLTDREHESMKSITDLRFLDNKPIDRELVVLKVLQKNKFNAWMRLAQACLFKDDYLIQYENYRTILAIFHDKSRTPEDQPVAMPQANSIRPISRELPPIPEPQPRYLNSPVYTDTTDRVAGLITRPYVRQGNAGNRISREASDITLPSNCTITEAGALAAMTTYTAYAFRPDLEPCANRSCRNSPLWAQCILTPESQSRAQLLDRIVDFERQGDSIIDVKLKLTGHQAARVTLLLTQISYWEPDPRFVHHLVELSMVDRQKGLIRRPELGVVDVIHIIVQRTPRDCMPVVSLYRELYRSNSTHTRTDSAQRREMPPDIVLVDPQPRIVTVNSVGAEA